MKHRLAILLLLVTAITAGTPRSASAGSSPPTPPPPPQAPPSGPRVAQIYPYEGHQGDAIYVSGRGFRPNTRVILLLACPSIWGPGLAGNYIYEPGPFTGRDGSFTAYRFRQKLKLHGVNSSSCLLYVYYAEAMASDFPVPYNAIANDTPLPLCVRKICAHISERTMQRHGRSYEHIHIQTFGPPIGTGKHRHPSLLSWDGAKVTVSVTYPHVTALTGTIGWDGSATLNIPLPSNLPQRFQSTVHASFRLGATRGDQVLTFIVRS